MNADIVKTILELTGNTLSESALSTAISHEQPCRMELAPPNFLEKQFSQSISSAARVYMDIGHNPQALENALSDLHLREGGRKLRIISGFSKNKDVNSILKMMQSNPHISQINLITNEHMKILTHTEI